MRGPSATRTHIVSLPVGSALGVVAIKRSVQEPQSPHSLLRSGPSPQLLHGRNGPPRYTPARLQETARMVFTSQYPGSALDESYQFQECRVVKYPLVNGRSAPRSRSPARAAFLLGRPVSWENASHSDPSL